MEVTVRKLPLSGVITTGVTLTCSNRGQECTGHPSNRLRINLLGPIRCRPTGILFGNVPQGQQEVRTITLDGAGPGDIVAITASDAERVSWGAIPGSLPPQLEATFTGTGVEEAASGHLDIRARDQTVLRVPYFARVAHGLPAQAARPEGNPDLSGAGGRRMRLPAAGSRQPVDWRARRRLRHQGARCRRWRLAGITVPSARVASWSAKSRPPWCRRRSGCAAGCGRRSGRRARSSPPAGDARGLAAQAVAAHDALAGPVPALLVEDEHRRRAVERVEQVAVVPHLGDAVGGVAPVPVGHQAVMVDQLDQGDAGERPGLEAQESAWGAR